MDVKNSLTLARKDLRIEFRTRQRVNLMVLFSFIILLMFNFAAAPYSPAVKEVAPGLLWFIFIFTALLGIPSSFTKELDRGTLDGL
ncbi:MAG: heme exporter protein CcmB, partial [Candidatus Hydrothermarchaeaceae archaeon]